MHAVFLTRGIKKDVDEFVKFMETRGLRLPYTRSDGKTDITVINGNLQPIQLWSYVFPEYEKDAVLHGLDFKNNQWNNTAQLKALTKMLRLGMGLKKCPEYKEDKKIYLPQPSMKNIAIIPIGVRYDGVHVEKDGTTHEAL